MTPNEDVLETLRQMACILREGGLSDGDCRIYAYAIETVLARVTNPKFTACEKFVDPRTMLSEVLERNAVKMYKELHSAAKNLRTKSIFRNQKSALLLAAHIDDCLAQISARK